MARFVFSCAAIVLLGLLAGCAPKHEPVTHKVTYDDEGETIEMIVGDQLQVSLGQVQFKDFFWHVSYYDPKCFEKVYQKTVGAGGTGPTAAASAQEIILFKAKKAGDFTLKLEHYHRSVEIAPDEYYTLEIKISEFKPARKFE